MNNSNQYPKVVVLLSGKRKSGKDFVADALTDRLPANRVRAFRIAGPIKGRFARDHDLDYDKLLDASPYKEQYRQQMVVWSERIRRSDPNYFLRLAIEESGARDFPVWLLTDARRECDVDYFRADSVRFPRVIAVRIAAEEETRRARGWSFTAGIDDRETECGLDRYDGAGLWDFLVRNDGSREELLEKLTPIVDLINQYCGE